MIEIKNLTQVYKSGKGIFNVDITVKEGEVFGYLGPNGAGKTTTIRGILGQMNADSGEVSINGLNPRTEIVEVNEIIGYLPGEMEFFDNYTGKQFLDYISNMRGLTDSTYREELVKRFELETTGLIKKMSKGMKQKVGIVAAFMHDPKILILDEPTSGLDPLMQSVFLDLILEEKKRGKTILMSSHIFEEVERVCDRAGIIKDGKIITIEDFSTPSKVNDLFEVVFESEVDLSSSFKAEKVNDTTYLIEVSNYKEFLSELSKYDVKTMQSRRMTIEDIFMKYYGGVHNG